MVFFDLRCLNAKCLPRAQDKHTPCSLTSSWGCANEPRGTDEIKRAEFSLAGLLEIEGRRGALQIHEQVCRIPGREMMIL